MLTKMEDVGSCVGANMKGIYALVHGEKENDLIKKHQKGELNTSEMCLCLFSSL